MPTEYNSQSVYRFEFDSIYYYPGTGKWFILKDPETGLNTIPGYEEERWRLRVRPLPFQEDWDEDDARAWGSFDCEVVGFNADPATREETGFPLLKQSLPAVLAKLYPESEFGLTRDFRVASVPGDQNKNGKMLNGFVLEDAKTGHTVFASDKAFGTEPPARGAMLRLHVSADGKQRMPHIKTEKAFLEDAKTRKLLDAVPTVFSEGSEYEAEVLSSEDYTPGFVPVRVRDMPDLPSRIPVRRDVPVAPGNKIRLRCTGFGASGFPKWAYASSPSGVPVSDLPTLTLPSGRETVEREFKSSLVYPNDGTSEPDVDKQLGYEIARVVASFMNREGGTVFIGVRDDGTVVGIETEADKINAHSDARRKYPPTLDGMQNKIVDTLLDHLGKGVAGLLDVDFFDAGNGKLVCTISVKANRSPMPVFRDDNELWVRFPGSTRRLQGPDMIQYVLDRNAGMPPSSKSRAPAPLPPPMKLPGSFKPVPVSKKPLVRADPSAVHRYLNLFTTGEASRTTRPLPETEPDCFCRLPIPDGAWNKKSRLLFCYDSGRVNVLNPKQVLEKTLKSRNVRHANGFSRRQGLMAVAICDEKDALVVRTRHKDGTVFVKCVPVGQCAVHVSMGTIGNDLTGLEKMPVGSKALDYRILPGNRIGDVSRLKPKKGNWPGFPQDAVADVWSELEQLPPLGIPDGSEPPVRESSM